MPISRRRMLKATTLLSAAAVGNVLLSARQAYGKKLPHRQLHATEVETVEALAETLVPGARVAGISYFLDQQFSLAPDNSLLMLRYFGVAPPYRDFYRPALASVERIALKKYRQPFTKLSPPQALVIATEIAQGKVIDWRGPAAPFFHFVFRSDAADVVYGTEAGFDHLNIPYRPHIVPTEPW